MRYLRTHRDDIVTTGRPFLLDLTTVPFVSVWEFPLIETLARTTSNERLIGHSRPYSHPVDSAYR